MYEWGEATFPTIGLFDQQVYVDNHRRIFKYVSARNTWEEYPDAYLKLVKTYNTFEDGKSAGSNPLYTVGELQNLWGSFYDTAYQLAFAEITFSASPNKKRIWGLGYGDYPVFCNTFYPQVGGMYSGFMTVDIYKVIDPKLNITRVSGHNRIYGSARGRKKYYHDLTKRQDYGIDPGFHNAIAWSPILGDFGAYLLNDFFGIDPGDYTNNEDSIWFSRNSETMYHQPKVGAEYDIGNPKCAYIIASDDYQYSVLDPFIIGAPKVLYTRNYGVDRTLDLPRVLRGNKPILDQMSAVMIYPLMNIPQTKIAFLMKPLGIDHIDFKVINVPDTSFFSETYFKNQNKPWLMQLTGPSHTCSYQEIYPIYSVFRHTYSQHSAYTNYTPEGVRFFRRNMINGVEGERSPFELKFYMNKTNSPMYIGLNKRTI